NAFMKALKMPKDTFKEIMERNKALADATLYSIQVPYQTATLSLQAMKELEFLMDNGNQNAITDIGVGTLMLCTGLEGAILNVKVNLMGLEDNNIRETYSEGCTHMLAEGKAIRDRLMSKVHERVEG
ncbi:cyclodeaminase/cyclohydrolase family protein, partial [Terrisporobacter sp.]|uniref:cyclodeaminase/cyclohydrolase family protein n=1 Tax=Terrisporobacter sp. TaxID=1965305 RepID=UPI002623E124